LRDGRRRRIPQCMVLTEPPLPREIWAATPVVAQAFILTPQERIRDLEVRLRQHSANSSRPPFIRSAPDTSAPEGVPFRTGARGQRGHPGAFRALLPVEQVDEIVAVIPERCRHCQQPLPEPAGRKRGRVWRHQSDSEAGSRFAERLLTVAASCRQQSRPLLVFLVAAVEAALRGSPPPSLIPGPQTCGG
jgi:Family of unknown function (DUF6444)